MDYGFVIDNRRCIGCHACMVACKAEHDVALGNFRPWVKYVENEVFPDVRRSFTVLRCKPCGDAPCINICPTRALFHRPDGIVDFDRGYCIGCRSCLAACPYDALYIDPVTDTAAKCNYNYCAHRIEVELEPACVTVCPELAIVAGDAVDPAGRIAQLTSTLPVLVRKPEMQTRPKVLYVEGEPVALRPSEAPRDFACLWAERPRDEIRAEHRPDDPLPARTTYDIAHERPWGTLVSLYLWMKSLAAGPLLVAALLSLSGLVRASALLERMAPALALGFTLATVLLLVADLERPARFLKVLTHPNPRSWLVWGAGILIAYSAIAVAWLALGLRSPLRLLPGAILWCGLVLAVLTAGYSGALLAQARGRELWSARLLTPHLIIQAFLAGAVLLACSALFLGARGSMATLLLRSVLGGLCAHGTVVLLEIVLPRHRPEAGRAVRYMTSGPLAAPFWIGAVFLGTSLPICLLCLLFAGTLSGREIALASGFLSLAGLLAYDYCYIGAGQSVPLG